MVTIEQRTNNRLILEQSDLISKKFDLYQTSAIVASMWSMDDQKGQNWKSRN